jgi:hypothetical protein
MRWPALRFLWLLLASCVSLAAPAADLTQDESRAVRAVIQAQLDAFKADDAKRAFSYASPGIRQVFVTPERFLAMVREQYPVVYRPASVSFLQPQRIEGEVSQVVRMSDSSGVSWHVVYRMEQQPDKSWRIAGCQAVQARARTV